MNVRLEALFGSWWKRIAVSLVALVLLSLTVVLFLPNPVPDGAARAVTIPRGSRVSQITDSLQAGGLLRSRVLFRWATKLLGAERRMRWGRFEFPEGASNYTIIRALQSGEYEVPVRVRFPEGGTVRRYITIASIALGVDSMRLERLMSKEELFKEYNLNAASAEGYLLPDTYSFPYQPDEKVVVDALFKAWTDFYNDSLRQREKRLGLTTHQVITLASIVQAESSIPEELPIIAGVYMNRLKRGMKLQADPTVQYALNETPRRLMYQDYRTRHAYNTYVIKGLPPGPIGNPSRDAILAVLYPARHVYLYFVANGDGGHTFSRTYGEHLKAVREYRKKRAQRATAS